MWSKRRILAASFALAFAAVLTYSAALADDDAPFERAAGTTRLEQRTPPGQVPPPPAHAAPAPALGDEQPSVAEHDDETAASEREADIIDAFRSAYLKSGSPRLAIYFNRELSDEIREWIPGDQFYAAVQLRHSVSGHDLATGPVRREATADAQADVKSRHYVGATGGRDDPREAWKWEFEDAITRLFLEGDANVVDRAVMFRQTAKQTPQTAGMDGAISTTLNEMSALETFADVLVEIKVTRSGSPLGYDFRATAKNVKSGRILGTAFVNGAADKNAKPRYVATDNGYERQDATADLTVEKVSRELALTLMQSLTPRLGK